MRRLHFHRGRVSLNSTRSDVLRVVFLDPAVQPSPPPPLTSAKRAVRASDGPAGENNSATSCASVMAFEGAERVDGAVGRGPDIVDDEGCAVSRGVSE